VRPSKRSSASPRKRPARKPAEPAGVTLNIDPSEFRELCRARTRACIAELEGAVGTRLRRWTSDALVDGLLEEFCKDLEEQDEKHWKG
jgi:hypothetical protein